MKKRCKRIIISFLTAIVIFTVLFQSYFCLLTYSILNESTNNNGNYAESKYHDRIDSLNYSFFNLLSEESQEVYNTIRNAHYYTYCYIAIPNSLNNVTVYYMYSRKYERIWSEDEGYRSTAASFVNCTVTWEYQDGWKITDYYEPP